ncbi:MAG: C/D box methylation guide ribonucleoprotein complex aNOP56 subunit [Candidatus Bathyarchaeota archaeon]|nr:C/D box methylation guide ribonucleoprotein complex aNOP56 subunit [Candidatus Bathyarchaeota archaeon]
MYGNVTVTRLKMEGRFVKATIVESVMGVFGFSEDNTLAEKVLFPKDPTQTAQKLRDVEEGKVIEEVAKLVECLRAKGVESFVFENQKMAQKVAEKYGVDVSVELASEAGRLFRENLANFAVESGYVDKAELLRVHLHNVSIELAKLKVKKTVEKRDMLVAQAVQSVDDLDKSLNLFMGRLREWFGLHYPELDRQLEKHETYARLVVNLGTKENFTAQNLENQGLPTNRAQSISKVAAASMGADISGEDLTKIQDLAKHVLALYDLRNGLEKYVDTVMEEVAPNTRAVGGSLLGARLLALSGGLVNLAKLPASTMQVLGAEKALFRSLKTKARPPKHGIIFQHPAIHDAKRWQRGKIARALAGKLSIAARVDAFNGEYVGDKLTADLEKRIEEIHERYPQPPPVSAPKPKKFESKKRFGKKPPRRKNRGSKR